MNSERRAVLSVSNKVALAALSIIGTVTILLATRNYGAELSPDSVGYIAAARHIASGLGVVSYDGAPLIVQPPLYPVLLATVDYVFGIDPLSAANVVNAVLFGLIVYLSGLLFFKLLKSSVALALLGTAYITVSIPLVEVSLMAWSEPLFISLVLLYLIFFESYLAKADITLLVLSSLSVALACLTRYIGVTLISTGIVSILVFGRDSLRAKIRHLVLFVSISALPVGMWLVRNYSLSGTFFGPRASSAYALSQNLRFMSGTFLHWYIPWRISEHRFILMLLCATVGILAGLSTWRCSSKVKPFLSEIGPLLLLIIAYAGFLLVSSTIIAYDQIDNRLLSPVFVPLTLLLLILASKILTSVTRQWLSPTRANTLLAAAAVMCLLYPARATMSSIANAMSHGEGYSGESWRSSQTIEYLRQNRALVSECVIYSNAPDAIYILADLTAKMSPKKGSYNSPELVQDVSSLRKSWPEQGNSCLVWFDNKFRDYLFTVDELQTVANMQLIMRTADGAVYSVSKKDRIRAISQAAKRIQPTASLAARARGG
jgi:hypothetical protein